MSRTDTIILQEHSAAVTLSGDDGPFQQLAPEDVEWLSAFTKGKSEDGNTIDVLQCLASNRSTAYDHSEDKRENVKRLSTRFVLTKIDKHHHTLKAKNVCGWLSLPSGRQIIIRSKLAAIAKRTNPKNGATSNDTPNDIPPSFTHDIGLHWLIAKAMGIRTDHYPMPTQHDGDRSWDYPLLPLVHLFADATDHLMRQGLHRFYVEEEETGPRIRGRILVSATMLHHARGRADIATCVADDLTANVFENRVLLTALNSANRLVRSLSIDNSDWCGRLSTTLDRLSWYLESEVAVYRDSGRTLASSIRRRLRSLPWALERYRQPLRWAAIILDLLNPDSGSENEFPAMLIDMPTLYERGLCEAIGGEPPRDHEPILFKSRGKPRGSTIKLNPRSDIQGTGWIVDAKYYPRPKPDPGHVYQAAFYALGYGGIPVALVYPWGPDTDKHVRKDRVRMSYPYVWEGSLSDLLHLDETAKDDENIELTVGIFVMNLTITGGDAAIGDAAQPPYDEHPFDTLDKQASDLRESLNEFAKATL